MLENKHYGRQIFLSLFVTVFLLVVILYLSVKFLVPMYNINQEQIYNVLVRLFPILIGLVMIEIGVLIARRKDEDYTDDNADKLPPNAYDRPLYTLPGDDPTHLHSDEMTFGHEVVAKESSDLDFNLVQAGPLEAAVQEEKEIIRPVTEQTETKLSDGVTMVAMASYDTSFDSILDLELKNAITQNYDLTLILIDIKNGPKGPISDKMIAQCTDLAYCYLMDNDFIAVILPFYNSEEAKSFMLSLIQDCKAEFGGCSMEIGFSSLNGRSVDSKFLYGEAEEALSVKENESN
ncbi:hypothetical protein [uncultured Sphaerochaeta sp.]|uniref:hypothetical protein n=1 Tax=uncultured Sphaerochaeta sp. TaxID=886478 RepID=UPI002A0AA059|nr:hypothetical protein [uncultured Sphaerochaeta sp.]